MRPNTSPPLSLESRAVLARAAAAHVRAIAACVVRDARVVVAEVRADQARRGRERLQALPTRTAVAVAEDRRSSPDASRH